jgi:hypothetical protein
MPGRRVATARETSLSGWSRAARARESAAPLSPTRFGPEHRRLALKGKTKLFDVVVVPIATSAGIGLD